MYIPKPPHTNYQAPTLTKIPQTLAGKFSRKYTQNRTLCKVLQTFVCTALKFDIKENKLNEKLKRDTINTKNPKHSKTNDHIVQLSK